MGISRYGGTHDRSRERPEADMTTFDSTKASLTDLLREITEGKIQLPDFQRGWVWDDNHIRDLLVSIGRSFPIGAIMLLKAGGEVRFQTRPVEGLEDSVPRSLSENSALSDLHP